MTVGVAIGSVVAALGGVPPAAATESPVTSRSGPPVEEERPAVWAPPERVNRDPVGEVPEGSWSDGDATVDRGLEISSNNASVEAPGLGEQGFYPMEAFPLSERLNAKVNVANGNLLVQESDVTINGPGTALRLHRFYNSQSDTTGSLGLGWSTSTGHDVGLAIDTSAVTFTAPSGFEAVFTPDSASEWVAPGGLNADLVENSDGTWTLTYRRSGDELHFTAGGYLTSHVDQNGVGLDYLYDSSNRVASITDAAGRVTTFSYTSGDLLAEIVDPAGRTTAFTYTAGRLTTVTHPTGAGATTYAYDTAGRLNLIQAPGEGYTRIGYTSNNQAATITRYTTKGTSSGDAAITSFAYGTGTPQVTTQTNPIGEDTQYRIDSSGRADEVTDPLGRPQAVTYTPNSDIATAIDAMGVGTTPANEITYTYDSDNNQTSVAYPTGAGAAAFYGANAAGECVNVDSNQPYRPKCAEDSAGNKSEATYDAAGNVMSILDTTDGPTGGAETISTYEGTDNVTCGGYPGQVCSQTDANGNTTNYAYDTDGNLTEVDPPGPVSTTTLAYDSLGRVDLITEADRRIRYAYDVRDRVDTIEYYGMELVVDIIDYTSYDLDGNLLEEDDYVSDPQTDLTTTYTYDGLNRQVSSTLTGYASAPASFTTTVTYDKAGNTLTHTDTNGTVTYDYDAANQLTSLTEPGGDCQASGSPGCTHFSYDRNGALTETIYPGGTTQEATYDQSGRLTRITAANAANTVLSDLSYDYARTSGSETEDDLFLRSRTDHLGVGVPAGTTTTYAYDSLARLTSATERVGSGSVQAAWEYAYDQAGNRTESTTTAGGSTQTTTWGYNAANQLISRNGNTAGWQYDERGNQTSNPAMTNSPQRTSNITTRDQIAAIATANGTIDFTYSGPSNAKRLTAGDTIYGNGLVGLTSTQTGSATPVAYTRTASGALISQRINGDSHYYLTDAQGSVVGLVDDTGTKTAAYTYDPYGQARHTSGPAAATNPFRYISGELDTETGLYKFAFRYYDPEQGRFTQLDPTGLNTNYTYAANNPVNLSDPTGAFPGEEAASAAIGAGFAAVGLYLSGGLLASAGLAFAETILETAVDCILGCDDGILYTALLNGTQNVMGLLTFGALDQALATFGAKSANALAEFIASQALNALQ